MKLMKQLTFIVLTLILLTSCAKVFYTPDAFDLAESHKRIAILPPTVSCITKSNVDKKKIKEYEKSESLNFQKIMYAYMSRLKNKYKMQGKYFPDIQDVFTTNSTLINAGYSESTYMISDFCSILGVDGILTSDFIISRPMSEEAAIALILLGGAVGGSQAATIKIQTSMSIMDCSAMKIIWKYEYKYSGSIGSESFDLVQALMQKAAIRMPYLRN